MYRHPFDLVRMFLSLFQDLPPMSRTLYIPGAVLLVGYPVLSVALGPDNEGQAFVTAFLVALAVRIGIGFEGMVRRMLTRYSAMRTALLALVFAGVPLLVLAGVDDPLWCQRMQSLFYVAIGGIFLMDVLKGRVATAASFWPDEEMRSHLPNLTRMMVVYNFSFLLLNETLIQTIHASHWLMFWALLPVIGHMVLRAMVLTVINLDDDGQPV
ncbi:hypothetical protein EI545_02605 [Tabrizicola piscis]|uniref:Uncharacterized protein n=1 Tax=Tabrizicola piscis TaxID=2494374 RepID=A0A3S8U2N5_9RHOB|nr:hypothetical protein [Tabrizicola piscis]AZL57825.1 hypothetical protein EI545_02605 [Tabrizicola piscis]